MTVNVTQMSVPLGESWAHGVTAFNFGALYYTSSRLLTAGEMTISQMYIEKLAWTPKKLPWTDRKTSAHDECTSLAEWHTW